GQSWHHLKSGHVPLLSSVGRGGGQVPRGVAGVLGVKGGPLLGSPRPWCPPADSTRARLPRGAHARAGICTALASTTAGRDPCRFRRPPRTPFFQSGRP